MLAVPGQVYGSLGSTGLSKADPWGSSSDARASIALRCILKVVPMCWSSMLTTCAVQDLVGLGTVSMLQELLSYLSCKPIQAQHES